MRFNDLIGCGGDTYPIKCHNNDVIVVMGSINQSKSFTVGVYRGRLPREFTVGGYRGRSPQEFTVGGHHGSLLWEVTAEFTAEGYHGSLPWDVTVGVYHGRSPREFTAGGSMI